MWSHEEVRRGLTTNTAADSLAWEQTACSAQVAVPTSGYTCCHQANQWCTLGRKLVGVQVFLIWVLRMRSVVSPRELQCIHAQAEAKSLPHPLGRWLQAPFKLREFGKSTCSCVYSRSSTWSWDRQVGPSLPQSKASTRLGRVPLYNQASWKGVTQSRGAPGPQARKALGSIKQA